MAYNTRMSQAPICTIGYGAREIEALIAVLQQNGIAYLIDVRSRPYSRYKPAFSKGALSQALERQGIRYVFMGDTLGGQPDDPACYTEGKVDYEKLAEQAAYQQGLARLKAAYQQQLPVVLMCSEGKPELCHRSKLIGQSLAGAGLDVIHIDENDRLLSQAEVLLRLNSGAIEKMAGARDNEETLALLKQRFGYHSFRPLQQEIINEVLAKRDALVVMPTGSGKSLCFQLPALLFEGVTLVVSPLISLMEDQVAQLREMGIAAAYLNSSLSYDQYLGVTEQIRAGRVKLLYAAPETLLRPETLLLLEQVPVDCFTIDESHCISEWGHEFRPEYRELAEVRRRLPSAVCLAVTATATDQVRRDIRHNLDIPQAAEFLASFDRQNLFLAVEAKEDLLAQTLRFLEERQGESGIIYCSTRSQVDMLAAQLTERGWPALPYHAGLDNLTRRRHQQQFSRDDVPIMVATIAFGMGINKSNVRFVLHVDLPKNLESYYQQIGRAGRDGLTADCLLLYSYQDIGTIQHFIQQQEDADQRVAASLRLEAMLGYAETNICRRRPLLAYFGEHYPHEKCDQCDNCTASQDDLVDLTTAAQKFLSCVKRTGQIFGVNHIIDVLRGSQSQKVLSRGHQQLSTYGIGREYADKEWKFLARQFVQLGLLSRDMDHGSLKLTEKGVRVLRGESVLGTLPDQPRKAIRVSQDDHDPLLFEQLRAKRKEVADDANLPPYIIFHDKTLVEMAAQLPQTATEMGRIYGIGEAKLAKYAEAFLPIIRAYLDAGESTANDPSGE